MRAIRLWYWWTFTIKKDEFSRKLDMSEMLRDGSLGRISLRDYQDIVIARRQLAHALGIDDSWKNIFKLATTNWYHTAFKYKTKKRSKYVI